MDPLFIDGSAGDIFIIHYRPDGGSKRHCVVVAPPFGEEMNKSRRQIALQARALAGLGVGFVVPDLTGTGESDGELSSVSLSNWGSDLAATVNWARKEGYESISVLAVRSGALLVARFLVDGEGRVDRVVFWQPATSGKVFLNQFLRLKVASAAMGGAEGASVKELRNQLADGAAVEVAGYSLTPRFFADFDTLALTDLAGAAPLDISWIDMGAEDSRLAPVTRNTIQAVTEAGFSVHHQFCSGPPFWATAEISTAPELVALTSAAVDAAT